MMTLRLPELQSAASDCTVEKLGPLASDLSRSNVVLYHSNFQDHGCLLSQKSIVDQRGFVEWPFDHIHEKTVAKMA